MITLTATDTLTVKENRNIGIYNYGEDNLYPQSSVIMFNNSSALQRCINTFRDFLFGRGVTENNDFWKRKINIYGQRVDQLVRQIVYEYSIHSGFALQFQYNALFEKIGVQVIPFEKLRLPKADDDGNITTILYHKDWSSTRIQKSDIITYNLYNTDKEVIARQAALAGGIENWNGQILYFGENGDVKYPHNTFHSVIEDVITDIKLKKGKNANASTNFMASHILQVPFLFAEQTPYENDKDGSRLKAEFIAALQKYQGAENLGKIMMLETKMTDKEGKAVFFKVDKLEIQNYDELFQLTENSVKENIRGIYKIPSILLEAVATGFSTEIMNDMYNYYNNITGHDRQVIEETLIETFTGWHYEINPSKNYSLTPLSFI